MGLIDTIKFSKEEKQKLEKMGHEAYAKNIIENEEVYGKIDEKVIKGLESISQASSELKEEAKVSIVALGISSFSKGALYGLGARLRSDLKNVQSKGGK